MAKKKRAKPKKARAKAKRKVAAQARGVKKRKRNERARQKALDYQATLRRIRSAEGVSYKEAQAIYRDKKARRNVYSGEYKRVMQSAEARFLNAVVFRVDPKTGRINGARDAETGRFISLSSAKRKRAAYVREARIRYVMDREGVSRSEALDTLREYRQKVADRKNRARRDVGKFYTEDDIDLSEAFDAYVYEETT